MSYFSVLHFSQVLLIGLVAICAFVILKVARRYFEFNLEIIFKPSGKRQLNTFSESNELQRLMASGSMQWDFNSKDIVCSEGFRSIYSLQKEVVQVMDICRHVYFDDIVYFKAGIEKMKKTLQPVEMHFRIYTALSEIKSIHALMKLNFDNYGEPCALQAWIMDETRQKKTEELLLTKALQLERSTKELQQFVSVASHDLQEPLRKLNTYAELLGSEYVESLAERGKKYVKIIRRSSNRLHHLIEDLSAFSQVGLRKEEFQMLNLSTLIRQVADTGFVTQELKIYIDDLPHLHVIPEQMAQLFQQLISNAVKYRKTDIVPIVHITSEIISGRKLFLERLYDMDSSMSTSLEYCLIHVHDNGIGFEEKYLDKIFTIFQQLHDRNVYDGTGIGLAICKKIVGHHQGFITAKSKPGEGSIFTVVLPYNSIPHSQDIHQNLLIPEREFSY